MPTQRQTAAVFLRRHPELHNFRMRRLAVSCLKICLIVLIFAEVTIFLYERTPHPSIIVLGVIIGLAAVFYLGKPHKTFRKMQATVVAAEYVVKCIADKRNLRRIIRDAMFLKVTVTVKGGKEKTLEFPSFYDATVREGDTILFVPGIVYPLFCTPREKAVCPYCGNVMPTRNAHCVDCKRKNPYASKR